MRTLVADLPEAVRILARQPRFLFTASLTLALGIGAVTAIFSVVNGVLLSPLPYPRSERLVNIWSTAPGIGYQQFRLSPDLFLFFRRHTTAFEDMALFQRRRASVTISGTADIVESAVTTHSYFSTLGVAFSQGRAYTGDEDTPEAPRVVVVSHRLWTRRYGADPALIGHTLRVDGEPSQVVGIAPAWLDDSESPDLWIPARFNAANPPSGFRWLAIGRLKAGVMPDQAASHLESLVRRAMNEMIRADDYRALLTDGRYRLLVHDMKEDLIGPVREPLWILLGTVVIVLLVACGNIANLCLARAVSRQREIAVRVSLGCDRRDLISKLVAEAFVLAVIATAVGVLLSAVGLPVLLQLAPGTIPRLDRVRMDDRVLAVAAGAAVLAALLFGLFPAIRYTRPEVLECLRHGGRSATDHPTHNRGRNLLVVAQIAMALMLLVGSGLLARSFGRLMGTAQGFVSKDVLTFQVTLPQATYPQAAEVVRLAQQLVDRLAELPGVEAAAATTELPVARSTSGTPFEFDGAPVAAGRARPIVHYSTVTPEYFQTLRIPLFRGAYFDSADRRDNVHFVIVNRAAAERHWPGRDPIGKKIRAAEATDPAVHPWYVVKGLVGDVRHEGLREPPRPLIYFPLNVTNDRAGRSFSYVLRGPRVAEQAEQVRRIVSKMDPDVPVASLQTMDDVVERSVMQFKFTMLALGVAAAIAMFLGAVGLYSVMSYAVSLRTREIGVRIALGAAPARIKRTVLANATAITGLGLLAGAVGAAGLTQFLEGLLYQTRPLDPSTFISMSALLLVVGLIAAYLPARSAASVSPIEAMRMD